MRLIEMFVRRPVIAVVVNLALVLIGLRAVTQLPIQQYPRIESSSIVITTVYVGASADSIRGFVTTPVERAVSSITGIDYVESSSVAGVSTVTARLKLNHPSTVALAEVGNRMDQIRSELPQEIESPVIEVQRADRPYATFYVSVISDAMTPAEVTDYLSRNIQPRLSTIPNVQRVGLEGARPQAMRIWLDADRLAAFGLGANEVEAALTRNNFLAAVGRTKGSQVQVDLLANTDLKSVEEFERLIVREDANRIVRISDLGHVELGSEEETANVRHNGKDAVYLSVWPLPGTNEIAVAYALRAELDAIRPDLPKGTEIDLAYDGTVYMENSLKEIGKTFSETVLIVGVIVFLFLGSWRSALVPLVTIPISLVGAAAAMLAMGFSLNLLTLLAIVLSVGIVVDDAIVVVENVTRHMQNGMSRLQAALVSTRQLFTPILAMTITLAAVYAPIGFLDGLTGVLFKEFAFTLAIAVIVSGFVAVTLSPVMSAYSAYEGGHEGRYARFVSRSLDRLSEAYSRALDVILHLRAQVLTFGAFICVMAVPLYMFSSQELAPVEDEGFILLIVNSAPDASLAYTAGHMDKVQAIGKTLPEYEAMFEIVFPSTGFGGYLLKNWHDRTRPAHAIQPEIFGAVSKIKELQVFPVLPPALPGAGNYDVELVLKGPGTPEQMADYAGKLVNAAFASGQFMFADTDLKIDLPQVIVTVHRERVADLSLDLADVGRQLGLLISGNYVNRFTREGRAYKVIPQVDLNARAVAAKLLDYKIRTRDGTQIPVSAIASLETKTAPRTLARFQQADSFRVYGGVAPGITKATALATLEDAARTILPADYTIDYAGESRQIRQEGATLAGTLGFAILLIYLVLVAQFGSFRDPLVVLLGSVPLALTAALVFTFLGFTTINIYSQIGLITLVGLIAKNGILIVAFANGLQKQGLEKLAAIREAAKTRLRPILMTTAATVFGHLPLVFVTGAGAEARNSIGIMLVTGMAIGTLFTLFILPVIYLALAAEHRPDELDAEFEGAPPVTPAREAIA
ncbi:efflux RND transporter permease subunit [uncultured Hyphomicrobium sp.]|uniref:efflux RND transporter permease subunit n=1 Tax=uncultured Hyphomicrobium sp. TaxID=194373 RepID=UPI0025D2B91C|nr:efflux RND transporter permease subunit [uncultured Hyphomicrobium sp.]